MSEGVKARVIRQGDTLLRLALGAGVEVEDIEGHPKNAHLRDYFPNEMLPVGEVVFLPRPKPPGLSIAPHGSNRFQGKVPLVQVTVAFADSEGPLAHEPYELHGLGEEPVQGVLTAAGRLELEVPVFAERLRLVFARRFVEHTLWVGHLAPKQQELGVQARLLHLGYLPVGQRAGDPYAFADRQAYARALQSFQEAHGLEPTGFADPPTLEKLERLHGW